MSDEPDYVVVRRGPDMPDEWLMPDGLEGKWFDRSAVPVAAPGAPRNAERHTTSSAMAAEPTGRFEVRDDGAVAEVWELRPLFLPHESPTGVD